MCTPTDLQKSPTPLVSTYSPTYPHPPTQAHTKSPPPFHTYASITPPPLCTGLWCLRTLEIKGPPYTHTQTYTNIPVHGPLLLAHPQNQGTPIHTYANIHAHTCARASGACTSSKLRAPHSHIRKHTRTHLCSGLCCLHILEIKSRCITFALCHGCRHPA